MSENRWYQHKLAGCEDCKAVEERINLHVLCGVALSERRLNI
jgi:hypothetical protein